MRLLLDLHIAQTVTQQLRAGGIDAIHLENWHNGELRTAADDVIITAAFEEGRIFVTFDLRTVPRLLRERAAQGEHHAGVIAIDDQTIRQQDFGGIIRALRKIYAEQGTDDWTDRMIFLQPD